MDNSSSQFITNQKDLLSDIINNILPTSDKLFFLVGYFYFSGFQKIYQNIDDKEMKILVGMDVETNIANKIKEFEILQDVNYSRGEIRENYYKSLVQLFNDTDYFDSKEKTEAFKIYLTKIQDGTLEIKKTKDPNHAKLYLFEKKTELNEGGLYPGVLITGSSNLTASGLEHRHEVNVILRDGHFYKQGYDFFKSLWDEAVDIANKNNATEFLTKVVQKIWLEKTPKPFLLYLRVLEEYFTLIKKPDLVLPSEISKGKFFDLKYQVDAIQEAWSILDKHGGVIIADVVGLGKSVIASVIAHNRGLRTVVISPPHLIDQWEDYRYNIFNFNAKVYSSGTIERALVENSDDEEKLIIIDEAHKYRNEETLDYANLHRLCQGNKVVLLTATPFNNRPQDIFSMVKLFQIPSRSTIQTVDNLAYQFRQLIIEYKQIQKFQKEKSESEAEIKNRIRKLADNIRDIISPLVIRRSRLDLNEIDEYREDLEVQGIKFPEVKEPQLLEYELGSLSGLYAKTLERIAPDDEEKGYIGARYKPTAYLKNFEKYRKKIADEFGDENLFKQSQVNLALFMRRLLVRRFESSVYAFKNSLESLIKSSEYIQDWYTKLDKVPIYKKGKLPDLESLLESTGEDLDDELREQIFDEQLEKYFEKGLQLIESNELKKGFIEDVQKDIDLLKDIQSEWFENGITRDPKLDSFTTIIDEQLRKEPKRKIVVFTEFADTANYLHDKLKDQFRVFKYTSADANKTNKQTIKENFDAGYEVQKDDYDLLIATDAISEGYNLHRAGTIFNYDIPYNPTRVIQRVGRINRINKKVFDELYIYNFFPTATGEDVIRVKEISTLKIVMIHALLGEDTKVLTSEEELESFYKERYKRAFESQEELSWDVKYRTLLSRIKRNNPEYITQAMEIPRRTRIRRSAEKEHKGVIIFGKKGSEYTFKLGTSPDDIQQITIEESMRVFEADISEEPQKTSSDFEAIYQNVKKNLFVRKRNVAQDRGKSEAIFRLDELIKRIPDKKDYFEDLKYVLKDLDSLPERFGRQIRAISSKQMDKDVEILQRDVPHSYLIKIMNIARQIEEGEEMLILAEELI